MANQVFLGVDLGASSGRHVAGVFDGQRLELSEVYRFENGPVNAARRTYWDLLGLWKEVLKGMQAAASCHGEEIQSVGVDTWGVDFALLGRSDELLGNPYHYRDSRTDGILDEAFQVASRSKIFAESGLQFLQFNTLYQLWAMRRENSPLLEVAERMLMMPDLFHWLMTGEKSNEYTDASTTQLYNSAAGAWSDSLCEAFDIPRHILGPVSQPGLCLGPLTPQVANWTGLKDVDVVLPPAHDTASAVLAVPAATFKKAKPDWCYISSGTWSLMGLELPYPIINKRCQELNFTNEGGVDGTVRLLKNISGLWLLQECRRIWNSEGHDYSWEDLAQLGSQAPPLRSLINPDDPLFLAPTNMPQAITDYCRRWGQTIPENHGAVIRTALESLALRYRQVLQSLEELVGGAINTIHIVGGGSRNSELCQMAADACGRRVVAGPVEATAIGNVMMQAISRGDIGSIEQAREVIRKSFQVREYSPHSDNRWEQAYERFTALLK